MDESSPLDGYSKGELIGFLQERDAEIAVLAAATDALEKRHQADLDIIGRHNVDKSRLREQVSFLRDLIIEALSPR